MTREVHGVAADDGKDVVRVVEGETIAYIRFSGGAETKLTPASLRWFARRCLAVAHKIEQRAGSKT
jgi:hypothetical protein